MKSGIPLIITATFVAHTFLGSVQAIPMYYQFEGSVSNLLTANGTAGNFEDIGLSEGDSISYTFMIDKSRQSIRESGEPYEDRVDGDDDNRFVLDHFYVELVESSFFDLVEDYSVSLGDTQEINAHGVSESHYRNGIVQEGAGEVALLASSDSIGSSGIQASTILRIYSEIENWQIGTTVSNDNRTSLYGGPWEGRADFISSLSLSAISTTMPTDAPSSPTSLITGVMGGSMDEIPKPERDNPNHNVPEPSTFLLVALGLLGIGSMRLRKVGQSR
jgi:hypothetical protein